VRTSIRILALAAMCMTFAMCSARPRPSTGNVQEKTTLRVENQGFPDMTIYVLQGGQRIRLGLATGNSTTVFTIPDYVLGAANTLRFLADPVGSTRTPVSDEISVHPGDQVTLTIPPS
jgi:hypothetical protein